MLTDSGKTHVDISFDFLKSNYNVQTNSDTMENGRDPVIDSVLTNGFACRQDYPVDTEYELLQWYMNALSMAQILLKQLEVATDGHMCLCAKHIRRLFKVKDKINSITDTSQPCNLHDHKDIIESGMLVEKYVSYLLLLKKNIRKCSSCLRERRMNTASMQLTYTTWDDLNGIGFVRSMPPPTACKEMPQTVPIPGTGIMEELDPVWRVPVSHNSNRSEAMMDKLKSFLCRQSGSYSSATDSNAKASDAHTETTTVYSDASCLEVSRPALRPGQLSGSSNSGRQLDLMYRNTCEAPATTTVRPRLPSSASTKGMSLGLSKYQFRLPQRVNRPASHVKNFAHVDKQEKSAFMCTHQLADSHRSEQFHSKTAFPDSQIGPSTETGAHQDSSKRWHNVRTIEFLTALAPNVYLLPPPTRNPFATKEAS